MTKKSPGRLLSFLPRLNYLYVFSFLSILIVISALLFSNRLVQKLAEKEERLVAFWADSYKFIATNDNAETNFLANNIIIKRPSIIAVPAIVTDKNNHPLMNNLNIDSTASDAKKKVIIQKELEKMINSGYRPISVEYLPGQKHLVYYRETDELIQLRYYPYITFTLMFIFIIIVFVNFNIAQRSEQNKVWAGLAKETAHQLGTPISGLIAWIELLRLNAHTEYDTTVVEELNKDVHHLQVIADRFSKIGSEPELSEHTIAPILEQATKYVANRVSSKTIHIEFKNKLTPGFKAFISPPLFEWVIENLLKNAIDALVNKKGGEIILYAKSQDGMLIVEVEDNGKGMQRQDISRVFRPGFTTKKRGWGLGLSLSKRIIEKFHNGKIFVKKSELDKGTTFRIQTPIVPIIKRKWFS